MGCPLFKDYTRECIAEIGIYPENLTKKILLFCQTDKFVECPFYKILKTKLEVCKNIKNCPAYRNFQKQDFDEFVEISNKYCTSLGYKKCERYVLSKAGKKVSPCMHPNGECIQEWKPEHQNCGCKKT